MMDKGIIINQETLIQRRFARNEGIRSGLYRGKMDDADVFGNDSGVVTNSKGVAMESIVVPAGTRWVDSEGYWKLWNGYKATQDRLARTLRSGAVNINQFPDDYYDLIDRIRIDITRRRMENMDFTSEIANEITNPAFSRSVALNEFLPFTGAFKEMKGSGDTVPMIQQKTGATGSVSMHIFGIGHERSLEDELYNLDIFTLQKVNAAVARAYTALRNHRNGIGTAVAYILAGAWPLAQRVHAAVGYGNYDLNLYYTLKTAVRKLRALTDPQTDQEINAQRIVLLVRENNILSDISTIVMKPLDIDEVWQYKGDNLYIDSALIEYPGIPSGTALLFVPGPAGAPNYVLNKRSLTQEVGRGDVLSLSREKRAFYSAQGEYQDEWFGEVAGGAAGTGFIVAVELPSYEEET
jgi:hypothetical protein